MLNIPEADRPKIGTGPTGRGKSLREGGVPMSERVRARREAARAREKQNQALGLPSDPNDKADMELDSDHDLDGEGGEGGDEDGISERNRSRTRDRDRDHEMSDGTGRDHTPRISPPRGSMPPPIPISQQQQQQPRHTSNGNGHNNSNNNSSSSSMLPLFQPPQEGSAFNYDLPLPFNAPLSPDNPFDNFESAFLKPSTGGPPNFSMFSLYEDPTPQHHPQHQSSHSHPPPHNRQHSQQSDHHNLHQQQQISHHNNTNHNGQHHTPMSADHSHTHSRNSPISPPAPSNHNTPAQPELLTRLKQCCHLSDSHVVNDPGLLIFATRLCQSFPCSFGGAHPDSLTAISDSDYLLLDDSWRALRSQLDPGTDNDGENRINTGRMAAELVVRAASARGQGAWILCRFREGMSIRRGLISALVNGLGGNFE